MSIVTSPLKFILLLVPKFSHQCSTYTQALLMKTKHRNKNHTSGFHPHFLQLLSQALVSAMLLEGSVWTCSLCVLVSYSFIQAVFPSIITGLAKVAIDCESFARTFRHRSTLVTTLSFLYPPSLGFRDIMSWLSAHVPFRLLSQRSPSI